MNDLDLLIAGAMVSFLSVAGAYIAVRHRANEEPVRSFAPPAEGPSSSSVHAQDRPTPR
ncbi:MAG: hypothetical protein KJO40_02190 [Deltaproteobacteria bacterium]|nr:hypothetical protein [Deltaproteobacteria bacterium]NND30451.1 hypothetical protein [Myxococcales bacterium]MBT8463815.1 hypothetical protein [Deltaproteobacteria bacterium]MBT8481006.1 hypothetical protein [Deltaproteobacteria bacterium]NNK07358.1 hypothetical protein [Myxococcales bacterium]